MAETNQAVRVRKQPLRSCVACRTVRDKRELIRIVRGADGVARLDPTGKANGRGAYLCANVECLRQAVRRKSLPRALRMEISAEALAALEQGFRTTVEQMESGEERRLP